MEFIKEFERLTKDKAENYIGNDVIQLCEAGELPPQQRVLIVNNKLFTLVDVAQLSLKASLRGGYFNV